MDEPQVGVKRTPPLSLAEKELGGAGERESKGGGKLDSLLVGLVFWC